VYRLLQELPPQKYNKELINRTRSINCYWTRPRRDVFPLPIAMHWAVIFLFVWRIPKTTPPCLYLASPLGDILLMRAVLMHPNKPQPFLCILYISFTQLLFFCGVQ